MRQPLLHDLVSTVRAPASALAGHDGQIRPVGVQGVYFADLRVLDRAVLRVDGREPTAVSFAPGGAGVTTFVGLARWLGDPGPDPTVRVTRVRRLVATGLEETITVSSTAAVPVSCAVSLELGCDLAPVDEVKSGAADDGWAPSPADAVGGGRGPATGTDADAPGSAGGPAASATGTDADGPGSVHGPTTGGPGTDADAPGDARGPAAGATGAEADAPAGGRGLTPLHAGGNGWRWASGGTVVVATGEAAAAAEASALHWSVALPPRGEVTLRWRVRVTDARAVVRAPDTAAEWSRPVVAAADRRLERLATRSLDDLESLRMRLTTSPDTFLAAGVPWFLTLFGRDSLWTARMLLPLGTGIAASTLRALAARQGAKVDRHTGEEPGKIVHELRRRDVFAGVDDGRPFAYYGSVDVTPLWICLLHDAWRWGLDPAVVEPLLPTLERALGWLSDYADADGDGFVEYIDHSGHGLANQGWKDSDDSVRFRTGEIAGAPIALTEVQGYAHEAALAAAALLTAFDRPGADRWRAYAAALADRFRAAFWVDGPFGAFPALALDGDKKPVDSLTSNIGHLLGTGILSPAEEATVAALLGSPALAGGFGLRTMSTHDTAFSPLSYHCGSIWAHDTAIVIDRLARAGFAEPAATLASGLLEAAEAFDYQLPELFGGDDRSIGRPVPYPAACRPQAWAAAAGVTLLHAAVGLHPDVPGGTARVTPLAGAPLGAVSVAGLRVAGAPVTLTVDATGVPTVSGLPAGLRTY